MRISQPCEVFFRDDSLVVDSAYDDEGKLLGYAVVSEEIGKFQSHHIIAGGNPTLACAVPACWSIAKATVPK